MGARRAEWAELDRASVIQQIAAHFRR